MYSQGRLLFKEIKFSQVKDTLNFSVFYLEHVNNNTKALNKFQALVFRAVFHFIEIVQD